MLRPGLYEIKQNRDDPKFIDVVKNGTTYSTTRLTLSQTKYHFDIDGSDFILPKAYVDKYRITPQSEDFVSWKAEITETIAKWKAKPAKTFQDKAPILEKGLAKFEELISERYLFIHQFPNAT